MRKWVWVAIIVAALFTGYAAGYFLNPAGVPPVKAYTEGKEIKFIHTEVSDPKVSELLTKMMGSPVLVVPSLAQAPELLLAPVYVFKNGVKGGGPFRFQPDVFDRPPGADGYSPLRAVHLVTWKNERAARELRSAAEVKAAEAKGEITIERP
ncbi:MAG: hypothetical protein HY953_08150, partial [Candidatus Rokubacteria bacterium]|nr:hypothetical protein [Candidatus Rokubacteria bacterium]